jgi:hypothetical protein
MTPKPFALAPAQSVTGPLDHLKTDRAKTYMAAIQQVTEQIFDCEPEGLFQFLKKYRIELKKWVRIGPFCRLVTLMMKILRRKIFSLITET